VYDSQVMTVSI